MSYDQITVEETVITGAGMDAVLTGLAEYFNASVGVLNWMDRYFILDEDTGTAFGIDAGRYYYLFTCNKDTGLIEGLSGWTVDTGNAQNVRVVTTPNLKIIRIGRLTAIITTINGQPRAIGAYSGETNIAYKGTVTKVSSMASLVTAIQDYSMVPLGYNGVPCDNFYITQSFLNYNNTPQVFNFNGEQFLSIGSLLIKI